MPSSAAALGIAGRYGLAASKHSSASTSASEKVGGGGAPISPGSCHESGGRVDHDGFCGVFRVAGVGRVAGAVATGAGAGAVTARPKATAGLALAAAPVAAVDELHVRAATSFGVAADAPPRRATAASFCASPRSSRVLSSSLRSAVLRRSSTRARSSRRVTPATSALSRNRSSSPSARAAAARCASASAST